MNRNRCLKIMSLVPTTSFSQETPTDTNNDGPPLKTTIDENVLDFHNDTNTLNDLEFDSDDSVFDKNYIPLSLDSDSSTNSIPNSQHTRVTIPESPEVSTDEDTTKHVTKKGSIRKRKKYDKSLAQRKHVKKLIDMDTKYKLRRGCDTKCRKKCHYNFTEDCRKQINHHFRVMNWTEQQYFIINNTLKENPKRKTVKENPKLKRDITVSYFLVNEKGVKVNVCKIFFLETLGYGRKNDKSVRKALHTMPNTVPVDNRGTNPNPKKLDDTKIIQHIHSFNPSISHYRREHAPNRKYLPSDLTVTSMYQDFCEQMKDFPDQNQISYDYYRKIVKKLNISFTKLGHEECELCEKYYIHNPDYKEKSHRNCLECKDYAQHHQRYILARQEYKKDVDKQNEINADSAYFSADLEKVIMLPRIDEFKIVMFCPRIIVFNESFVPIGDKKNTTTKTYAAIWHESVSGRKMHDIASCFRAFLLANRDLKSLTIWLDNCAAQNKNWTLFSYLLNVVNSVEVNYETIKLKYLEVGHTYMAADEFHHQVELAMKKKKHVYDFEDFHQAVTSTRQNINVKVMNVEDFYQFEDCSSSYKLQNSSPRAYLGDMCEVTFFRGNHVLRYKTIFDGPEYTLDFLRVKNIKSGLPSPKQNTEYRGITQERKSSIIQKLTPLMPDNRRPFWYNLHVNKNSCNLNNFYED